MLCKFCLPPVYPLAGLQILITVLAICSLAGLKGVKLPSCLPVGDEQLDKCCVCLGQISFTEGKQKSKATSGVIAI